MWRVKGKQTLSVDNASINSGKHKKSVTCSDQPASILCEGNLETIVSLMFSFPKQLLRLHIPKLKPKFVHKCHQLSAIWRESKRHNCSSSSNENTDQFNLRHLPKVDSAIQCPCCQQRPSDVKARLWTSSYPSVSIINRLTLFPSGNFQSETQLFMPLAARILLSGEKASVTTLCP